ncbi:MAG: hypothetical protein R3E32_00105 [Chitinophagales bacterium]
MKKFSYSFLSISLLSIFCLIFVSSCEDKIETFDLAKGLEYFPTEQGFWLEYKVDSVLYSPLRTNGKDTVSMQMREVFGQVFFDNEGREAITIERYVRPNQSIAWKDVTPTIWYAVRTDDQVERVEGDLRFMKLIFPVFEGRIWDGNTFINTDDPRLRDYRDWNYEYIEVAGNASLNGLSFAETLTVSQIDREDLVNKTFAIETYAKNVGLIKKEEWILKRNDTNSSDDWPQRAETGYLTVITLTDYKQ